MASIGVLLQPSDDYVDYLEDWLPFMVINSVY